MTGATACVVPATLQILLNATCASLAPLSTQTIDIAGMVGEKEHVQILVEAPSRMTISAVTPKTIAATIRQVGYVDTKTTTRYSPSGGGWRPDPLLELEKQGTLIEAGVATPLWVTVELPTASVKGGIELTLFLAGHDLAPQQIYIPVSLTTWPGLALPSALELHRDFPEIWSFEVGDLQTLYKREYTNATAQRFRAMMTDALLPPDWLYKSAPYADLSVYDYLRQSGAYLLNLADIGRDKRGCPEPYTPSDIKAKLDALAPAIEHIGSGSDVRPYVYGYDEQPISCEANIRKLFGAVKARWPHVATAAVLNWKGGLPTDLPVDIWIVQYEDWEQEAANRWQSVPGKQLYAYHCIEPSGGKYLNTFIERPRTQGRQLYWLAADRAIDGWLYYATDIWRPRPGGAAHKPVRRIDRSPRTDFDPSNYIWSPRTDIFANGDGQFVYPGVDPADDKTPAPVASARLELQRDAVEDAYLLRMARRKLGAAQLSKYIRTVVRSPTDHTDDPALLEQTRREVAKALGEALAESVARERTRGTVTSSRAAPEDLSF